MSVIRLFRLSASFPPSYLEIEFLFLVVLYNAWERLTFVRFFFSCGTWRKIAFLIDFKWLRFLKDSQCEWWKIYSFWIMAFLTYENFCKWYRKGGMKSELEAITPLSNRIFLILWKKNLNWRYWRWVCIKLFSFSVCLVN